MTEIVKPKIPKIKFEKSQVLLTYKKEIETGDYNVNLIFKLVKLTEIQKEEFKRYLIPDSFNSDLLIFQKSERIHADTGEITQNNYGVCEHMGYIHEVYENYLRKKLKVNL